MAASCIRALALVLIFSVGGGQVYSLDRVPVPQRKSLLGLQRFYIYSTEDAPRSWRFTGAELEEPSVSFSGVTCVASDPKRTPEPGSVQLILLPYRDFKALVNPFKFCATKMDVQEGFANTSRQFYVPHGNHSFANRAIMASSMWVTHNIPCGGPRDQRVPVQATGAYALILSNCGETSDMTVSGEVIVRNVYGYLPGHSYHRMLFFGAFALMYLLLTVAWLARCLPQRRAMQPVHHSVLALVASAAAEASLEWLTLMKWNASGKQSFPFVLVALLASIAKSVAAYFLLLLALLRGGSLDHVLQEVGGKVLPAYAAFLSLELAKEVLASLLYSKEPAAIVALVCSLPVVALNVATFCWIFSGLADLIQRLQEDDQLKNSVPSRRLWSLLQVFIIILAVATTLQIATFPLHLRLPWLFQWFLNDGVAHFAFFALVIGMVNIWFPDRSILQGEPAYAGVAVDAETVGASEADFSPQEVPGEEEMSSSALGEVEMFLAPGEVEMSSRTLAVAPQVIGLPR